jgi:hypothetical protein
MCGGRRTSISNEICKSDTLFLDKIKIGEIIVYSSHPE